MATPIDAEVLNQALPYIQRFRGQTFVVKYGGSAMTDPQVRHGVLRNVLLLHLVGIRVVLVHGGGPEIDRWLARLEIPKKVLGGLRVTDDETMEVVEMALGRANKSLASEVRVAGGQAVGLSGRDGALILAEPVSDELGRTGRVLQVNPELLVTLLDGGFVPVVCSVADDPEGRPLNVNADTAAAAIAGALGASKLILLSDTDGVLADKDDPSTRISEMTSGEARAMLGSGKADRGMIPKLEAVLAALEDGVERVHLINAGNSNSLLAEVLTDGGVGTMVARTP